MSHFCLFFVWTLLLASLAYYQYEVALSCLQLAEKVYGKGFSLSGALGKKTKFQQFNIAQLYVKIDEMSNGKPEASIYDTLNEGEDRLSDILLEDDQLLSVTTFEDEQIAQQKVSPMGNAIVISKLCVLMKTGPAKERINEEEQLAFLNFIHSNASSAALCSTFEALRARSKLEVYKFSKVQRGMQQLQALLDFYNGQEGRMLRLFYASDICTRWQLRRQLCDSYVKLGLVQSALDEYMGKNYRGSL